MGMQTHRGYRIDLDEFLNGFTAAQAIGRHAWTTVNTELDGDVEVDGLIEAVMPTTIRIGCPVGWLEVSSIRDMPVLIEVTGGEADFAIRATHRGMDVARRLAEISVLAPERAA